MKTKKINYEKKIFLLAGLVLSLLGLNGQNALVGYKIVQKIQLSGDGGWDYLNADDATGLLYVSHGKMVNVVDMNTDKSVATITEVNGVHGIAIAPEFNRGFISNGPDSNVTVFNTKDYSVIKKVPVTGKNPDAIIFEPFTKTIITWNGRSSNATTTEPGERNYLNACFRTLGDYYKNEKLDYASKNRGSSVRCVRD